ncbi:MAG: hypothetical protein HFACDABA_02078 [Anaerolineales bacterium]|nr:hypothetical protein [Anaerolineales bacterium]
MTKLSRRDMLKVSAAALGGAAVAALNPSMARMARAPSAPARPNILIIVFDTMSALHLSLYGYGRNTSPNLDRFAGQSIVYHSHYSAANYTTPGTASILTGLHVWSHRALSPSAPVLRHFTGNNIFRLAGREYARVAFTQNLMAEMFLRQFHADIDLHLPPQSFAYKNPLLLGELNPDDPLASLAFDDFLVGGYKLDAPYAGSAALGTLDLIVRRGYATHPEVERALQTEICFNGYFYYKNRLVFEGLHQTLQRVAGQPNPFFGYFHLWSPHEPYSPTQTFDELFEDKLRIPAKPDHPFADPPFHQPAELYRFRRVYDRYIANVDAEFGRLMDSMAASGILDNTCVIFLSDHGQLFERGVHGHASRLLHQPVLRVPLLIHMPGQTKRLDVHAPTSNVDLLPTLASIMDIESEMETDGRLLPGLGGAADETRPLFAMRGMENPALGPLKTGTFVLVKERHKLQLFTGYRGLNQQFELYDLESDPEELHDLSASDAPTARRMQDELLTARDAADRAVLSADRK